MKCHQVMTWIVNFSWGTQCIFDFITRIPVCIKRCKSDTQQHTWVRTGEQTSLLFFWGAICQSELRGAKSDIGILGGQGDGRSNQYRQRQCVFLYMSACMCSFSFASIIPWDQKLISSRFKEPWRKSWHQWLNRKSYLHGYTLWVKYSFKHGFKFHLIMQVLSRFSKRPISLA